MRRDGCFSFAVFVVFSFFSLAALSPVCAADSQILPVADLVERARELDGTMVTIEGEAIGSLLYRQDHAWINVGEKSGALGVWSGIGAARAVHGFGSHAATGDIVRVTGEFHRACPEHGGDMDIHAVTLIVTSPGYRVLHPVSGGRVAAAIVLSALAIALTSVLAVRIKA